jgi:hypothetical protein
VAAAIRSGSDVNSVRPAGGSQAQPELLYQPPGGAAQPGSAGDWFTAIQHRLRDLGATYYLLETWGRQGELYRFHCKMAIAGNPNYTQHFEATDSDPSRAMQSVLRQVEAWRAGRAP